MTGRKRKPDHLKVVQGTYRPDRAAQASGARPAEDRPVVPAHLSERGADLFRVLVVELEAIGAASASYTHLIGLTAQRLEEVELLTIVLEDGGFTYASTTAAGAPVQKPRPEVPMRNQAMRHAHSLLAELGLSPTAISRVTAAAGRDKNPFADL